MGHPGTSTEYTRLYYTLRKQGSSKAADLILRLLFDHLGINSVIDVGCGTGAWLHAARRLGASRTVGIENQWVTRDQFDDGRIEIRWQDLEMRLAIEEAYDLCICLEVAEHLSPARAESFIDDLCQTSKRILFGAAVPGQRGRHHVNEQWQSFWASRFKERDYIWIDAVRPTVWDVGEIPYWYRQNTLIYVHESQYPGDAAALHSLTVPTGILDVVHPDLLTQVLERPDVTTAMRTGLKLPGAIIRAVKRRAGS